MRERQTLFADVDPTCHEGMARTIEACLRWDRPEGATVDQLQRATLLTHEDTERAVATLERSGRVDRLASGHCIHRTALEGYVAALRRMLEAAAEKGQLNLPLSQLRKDFEGPDPVWERALANAEESGLVRRRREHLILAGAVRDVDPADRTLMNRIAALYEDTGFESPRPQDLAERLGASQADADRLLKHLCSTGELIRLAKHVVVHHNHYRTAQQVVVDTIAREGSLDTNAFKTALGASRKYALAFLEHLDAQRITVRVGNTRKLTPDYEKRLI